jgi:hypothetical protein
MKKIITGLFLLMVIFSVTKAQAQQSQSDRAAAMKQKMKDDLKMTDTQADSVVAIQQDFRPQMRDIYMDQSLSQDDKQAKLAPIIEAQNKRLQAALGDDMFKQYTAWWQKNRPQRGGGGGGGGGSNN